MRTLIPALLLAELFLPAALPGQSVTRKSPELVFTIPAEGQKLLSQYRGKVVALEFISTTCPHCQAASKVMTGLQQKYAGQGLQVLDIAINPNSDLLVDNFSKEFKVGFPVGWISIEQMMTFMGFTDRPVVPQLVLIDRRGYIHYQTPREGDGTSLKPEVIEQRIVELLHASL